MPTDEEVQEAAACHLRPNGPHPPFFDPCKYCTVDEAIQDLQDLLYMKMTYNTGWACLEYSALIG